MAEKEAADQFDEERRSARRENDFVRQIRAKTDLSDAGKALKLYDKLIRENYFKTMVGYAFLEELRDIIIRGGAAREEDLAEIPGREPAEPAEVPLIPVRQDRFKKKYEGQVMLNKKLKIAVAALVILLVGFVVINFKFEYSIFTFFTNYKANMEEELIDKYKDWENQLHKKQEQLEQQEGADQNG